MSVLSLLTVFFVGEISVMLSVSLGLRCSDAPKELQELSVPFESFLNKHYRFVSRIVIF